MELIAGLIFLVLTYVVFVKLPAPAPLIAWGFTAILMLLSFAGTVEVGIVYMMYILLVAVLMISSVMVKNT